MSRIPDHAKRVFKGLLYDVYQWEQELFDGSTTTFEMLKRTDTVVVLPLQGDRALYARQEQPGKPPFFSLFGGRIEGSEAPLDIAKRELLEETGMVSEEWEEWRHYCAPGKIEWNVYYFIARNCKKVAEPQLDGGEKIEIRIAAIDEFITKIIPDLEFSEREIREEILSALNPAVVEQIKNEIMGGT